MWSVFNPYGLVFCPAKIMKFALFFIRNTKGLSTTNSLGGGSRNAGPEKPKKMAVK